MMKKMFKIVMAIMIAITCVTCTKFGKNITVKGRVLNPITGEGCPNAFIYLKKNTIDFEYYGSGQKTFKETKTDANGEFEISAGRLSNSVGVFIGIGNSDYYPIGWLYKDKYYKYGVKVDKGKVMHIDYHLVPYGQLQIKIKNTACVNSLDKVGIYFDGEYIDSKTFMKGLLYEKDGCIDVLDSPVKTTIGSKYFHWVVTKDNITTIYYDTIFVNANQTTILNVTY